MEQQKWTLKEIIFKRETTYENRPNLHIDGFKLPKDSDFLVKVLQKLYEVYPLSDTNRLLTSNALSHLEHELTNTSFYIHLYVNRNNYVGFSTMCSYNFPEDKGLTYIEHTGRYSFITKSNGNKSIYHIAGGLHIHKDCLEIGD